MKLTWKTEQRRPNDLIPLTINPRKITEEKRQKLIESLEKFNLVEIPAINMDGTIIAGHQRITSLQIVGRGNELIDVRVPNRLLTETEVKEYNLLSNTHSGEFDFEVLDNFFADIDIEALGVEIPPPAEIEPAPVVINEADDIEDLEQYAEQLKTDIVLGDMFQIGKHRLLCGDSRDVDSVAKLIGGGVIDMILTDPPYGVSYVGKTKDSLTIKNDKLSEKETHQLWNESLLSFWPFLKEGGTLYATVPAGPLHIGFAEVLKNLNALRQIMVWNKKTMVLGHSDYHYQHEPILYGWKPGASHYFINDRTKTTVFDVIKPMANKEHPTMKPVELFKEFINNSTKGGWSVADMFGGSGTTMVAAELLNRKSFLCEYDPVYCQVIINRMQKLFPGIEVNKLN